MRPKSLALLMLALGCGLVASIGIMQLLARRHAETEDSITETQTVFVAIKDVALGDLLSSQLLKLEQWPKDKIPPSAISRIEDIEGRRVRTHLYAGEPILENKLMGKGASEQGATSLIPKGYRVVSVRVDMQSGTNLIQPGDRVDVMVHLVRDPSRDISETVTRTILQDIKVFAVNDVLDLEKEKDVSKSINAKTISLLVTPDQAAEVMLAGQMGIIQLVMRSPEDDVQSVNAQAKPSELFGAISKSDRSKETLMETPDSMQAGKGFVNFLNTTQAKSQATSSASAAGETKRSGETWTIRILQPGAVSDVVLESDGSPATAASPFGWRATTTTSTPASSKSSQPSSSAQPQNAAPEQPSTKEPPVIEEPVAPLPPDTTDSKKRDSTVAKNLPM